ncbi:MAG: glycosyltransferase family 2 protein [Candidatus Omnitrophica bacterium]|nr:glycosyltransferase family 2 protein [Candidatus Omnitrophota bacterium]
MGHTDSRRAVGERLIAESRDRHARVQCGHTLEKTYRGLPAPLRRHVLLGDNQSTDDTAAVAERLSIDVIRHEKNHGYGGNLKRLFRRAIEQGADIVVELHPDFQYEPGLVDILVEYIHRGYFDVMQGNRIRSRDEALAGGMHWYRYLGNRLLTLFENVWFGISLGEWHSGMKAFRREVLERLPLDTYSDTHAFASHLLMDCVMKGFRIGEIPIPVRYDGESSSVSPKGLFAYTVHTLIAALQRPPWKKRRFGSARLPMLTPRSQDRYLTDGSSDRRLGALPSVHGTMDRPT